MEKEDPVRFGAEFGPKRTENSTGVSLGTFKNLVWISNLGGLLLVAIGLELIMVQQQFYLGVAAIVGGVAVALFPSNYEIVGMEAIQWPESDVPANMAVATHPPMRGVEFAMLIPIVAAPKARLSQGRR